MKKIERRDIADSRPQAQGDRIVRFVATTAAVDSHNSIVVPAGIHLARYRENPVFTWQHAIADDAPAPCRVIGRVVALELGAQGLVVDVEFAPAHVNALAEECLRLVRAGFLKAVSISFLSLRSHQEGEITVHDEVELTEISLVVVGSNPEALALRSLIRGKGMTRGEACKMVGLAEDASDDECRSKMRGLIDEMYKAMGMMAMDEMRAMMPEGEGRAAEDCDKDKDKKDDEEKRGLRRAVEVLQAEVSRLGQVEQRAAGDVVERWADEQIREGRFPKEKRAELIAERRSAPKAAETLVNSIPRGHFTRGVRISDGGAPLGTTPEQAQPEPDRAAPRKSAEEIVKNAQIALHRRTQGLGA